MELNFWKDIIGYEGYYQISKNMEVRSLDRIIITNKGQKKLKGKILIQNYAWVGLHKNNKTRCMSVSLIFDTCFLGKEPIYLNKEELEYHHDKEYYEKNKEKLNELTRKYKEENKEKTNEYARKYREENKEKRRECQKKYTEENKEKLKEYARKYTEENKEKIKEYKKKYYQKNKENLN